MVRVRVARQGWLSSVRDIYWDVGTTEATEVINTDDCEEEEVNGFQ